VLFLYFFTDAQGRRIMRVFSFGVRVSTDVENVMQSLDERAMAAFCAKKAAAAILAKGPAEGFKEIEREVRKVRTCGARFRILDRLLHGLLSMKEFKRQPFYDWIFAQLIWLRSLSVVDALLALYPRFIRIDSGKTILPLTAEEMTNGCCFALHTATDVFIWVDATTAVQWLGMACKVDEQIEWPEDISQANPELNAVVQECWEISGRFLPVTVVQMGSLQEAKLRRFLIDDSTDAGAVFQIWKKQMMGHA
jgi:hypothetical protein